MQRTHHRTAIQRARTAAVVRQITQNRNHRSTESSTAARQKLRRLRSSPRYLPSAPHSALLPRRRHRYRQPGAGLLHMPPQNPRKQLADHHNPKRPTQPTTTQPRQPHHHCCTSSSRTPPPKLHHRTPEHSHTPKPPHRTPAPLHDNTPSGQDPSSTVLNTPTNPNP